MDAECQSFSTTDILADARRNSGSFSAWYGDATSLSVATFLLPVNQS